MKIAGKVPGPRQGSITLDRGDASHTIRLRALPFGTDRQLEHRLGGAPQPPLSKDFVRNKTGFVRDEDNQPFRLKLFDDPTYVAASAQHNERRAVAMFLEGLDDNSVEFTTKLEDDGSFVEYIDKVIAELEAAGISSGEIIRAVREINRLSGLSDEELEAAKEGFLPE